MFLDSSNQLNALVTITFCEKISMRIIFFSVFLTLKFPQLSSSFDRIKLEEIGQK